MSGVPYEFDAEGKKKTSFIEFVKQQEEVRTRETRPPSASAGDPSPSLPAAGDANGDPADSANANTTATTGDSSRAGSADPSVSSRRSKMQQRARQPSQVGRVYEQVELSQGEFIEDEANTEPVPVNASALSHSSRYSSHRSSQHSSHALDEH